eukprot:m.42537 g.42537  ORF g.42537 m.42537 type:complete len:391 (-) comp12888_c0_seq6:18-1190(-)
MVVGWYKVLVSLAAAAQISGAKPASLPHAYNVVWNAPANGCEASHGSFNLTDYSILENPNDAWQGDEDTLFYKIGTWPTISKTGVLANGGIPQNACLPCHLKQVQQDVAAQIADPHFAGLGIIDFEAWRPLFALNWDSLSVYQRASINYTKAHHPDWTNETQILLQAKQDFNTAAKAFFLGTLEAARSVRPNGLWGYYQYPYCGYTQNAANITVCNSGSMAQNDELSWLWEAVDVIFPEIYQYSANVSLSVWQGQVAARVGEAVRLAGNVKGNQSYVLPYGTIWTTYHYPNGTNPSNFLKPEFLDVQIVTPTQVGADGVVLWGSSAAVRTSDQCNDLESYIATQLGPLAKTTVANADICAQQNCHNNGTCLLMPSGSTNCRCYFEVECNH